MDVCQAQPQSQGPRDQGDGRGPLCLSERVAGEVALAEARTRQTGWESCCEGPGETPTPQWETWLAPEVDGFGLPLPPSGLSSKSPLQGTLPDPLHCLPIPASAQHLTFRVTYSLSVSPGGCRFQKEEMVLV